MNRHVPDDPPFHPLKVGLISLGCAKNLVDAEIMLGTLLREGCTITSDTDESDAVIVNTCSFIADAQEESIDAILECARARDARHPDQALIVSGCLPQRFRDVLPRLLPEVDAFMGIDQVTAVADIVRQAVAHRTERRRRAKGKGRRAKGEGREPYPLTPRTASALVEVNRWPRFLPDCATPRVRLTPRHFAYMKIGEGCNHTCSFCIIPRMRGRYRSRPERDIVEEARRWLAQGVKELNLIAQDTTAYGLDLRLEAGRTLVPPHGSRATAGPVSVEATDICSLLRALNDLPGDFWIRLLYTHPAHWTDELIRTIAACRKVARYVDIPLQHIHPVMLERMRRRTTPRQIRDLLGRIRAGVPGIALRTAFIVGFPGETEECFEVLLEFIRATRFERLGVFAYSREEGTAAGKMPGQVPEAVRRRRHDRAMAAQRQIAREHSVACVGRTLRVLVDDQVSEAQLPGIEAVAWRHGSLRVGSGETPALTGGGCAVGRAEADAPDIDGRVYVRGRVPVGEFVPVRIVGHADYDLLAEPVYE